jgi:diguanylate cyclase (GGDEF)-like protein
VLTLFKNSYEGAQTVAGAQSVQQGTADPVRVLFIEDNEVEAELTARRLRLDGIAHVARRVDTEEDMRAALTEFKPGIILSDFTMPRFDGLSALSVAREVAPEVPFVFVSGTIGEERAIEALHYGAVDYVLKSNLARLGPAVRRALAEARAREVARRQERQIERLTGVLRMLSGINSIALRVHDRNELLHEACRLAVAVGGYDSALAYLLQPNNQRRELVAAYGVDADTAVRLSERIGERAASDRKTGKIRSDAVPALVFTEAEYRSSTGAAQNPAGRPMVALPLAIDTTVIGVFAVCCKEPGPVNDEEMRMLREVAANVAFVLQYLQRDSKVRLLSYFDVRTGLAMRPLFCERLNGLLSASGANGSRYIVAVTDVENLSAVNDSFGRHAGDRLLQLLADRLKQRFAKSQLLAHLSGGTFAIAQPVNDTWQDSLETLRQEFDVLFGTAFELEGKNVPIAARSGVALFPDDGRDPEVLVQRAEAALRTAKDSRERHGHYSREEHETRLAQAALERRLRVAIEKQQFELHYQPKVSVKTRRIEGVEALIRWRDSETGLVSPAEFLPILEMSGLIVEVGNWVIERAAADCRQWEREGLPIRVAVNISPLQLRRADFVARFFKHTHGWTSDGCGLDVEIVESVLLGESSTDVGKLKVLRAAGVHVAIDDFGTGYSSLGRLSDLPVDTLKVDRTFISKMSIDPRARKLVSVMISIARAFKMKCVAEGVEHQEQLDALWQMGCDQSQGYLHSKPVTSEEFVKLLQDGRGRFILPLASQGEPAQIAERTRRS